MAPLDRRSECALALGQVARTTREKGKPLLEPGEDLLRGERLHAGGGQLERKREVVEAQTDLRNPFVRREVGLHRSRPSQEEADALLANQRRHQVLLFAGEVEWLAARHQQIEAWAAGEKRGELGCRLDDLLEVVEEEEKLLVCDVGGWAIPCTEHLACALDDERRVAKGRKRHPEDPVRVSLGERACRLGSEPRLSRPTRPGEREQADILSREELEHLAEFLLASEEGRLGDRQVRLVKRLER